MTQAPYPPMPGPGVRAHRGTMILVFGILGIVCCIVFGILAWVMGDADLKAMERGEMDRSGESLTKAGKVCGIIGVVLQGLYILLNIIFIILGMGLAFMPPGATP